MTEIDFQALRQQWVTALDRQQEFARAFRRDLHQNPRISGDESDTTSRFLAAVELTAQPIAETGAITRFGPSDGPAIGLRGELDALPVKEQTGLAWAATNGAMHACGHDVHIAALAAVVRASREVELPLAIVPMLQPREETYPSGALDICESGALEELDVAVAVGAHVHPRIPKGELAIGGGAVNAAAGELQIEIVGSSGHGAYPHQSRDIVHAAASIAMMMPEIVRRTVDPMNPAVISVGRLVADSGAANVLPGAAFLAATVRTTNAGDADLIHAAVSRAARKQAEAFGVTATVKYIAGEPVLFNHERLSDLAEEAASKLGLKVSPPMRSLGADDFSYYGEHRPAIMCFVGVGDPDEALRRSEPSLHDATFLPDEDAVMRVARALVAGYLAGAQLLEPIAKG